jgi:hypothetical protein
MLAGVMLLLAACTGGSPSQPMTVHGANVTVSTPAGALDGGASIRVAADHSRASQPSWPATIQVTPPLQIEPTKGQLHGQATLVFKYPQHLPAGVTPRDLMVTVYNEAVRARVPLPFVLNERARTLTIFSDHFSKGWGEQGANPQVVKDAQNFGLDVAGDAARNHGDAFAGWMKRALPPVPEVHCDPATYRLTLDVTDYGTPDAKPVCAAGTSDSDVVRLKLANTHQYPVLVTLPKGVTLARGMPGETDDFEEVMSQLAAQYTNAGQFLLRGDHVVELEVRLSELQPEARITTHVDGALLLEDMMLWTVDLGVGQKGGAWKALGKFKDDHEDLDQLTKCFQNTATDWQNRAEVRATLEHGTDKEKAKLIQKALDDCSKPSAKAIHGLFNRLWHSAKKKAETAVEKTVYPVERIIKQLKVLWDNPGELWEWTEGLLAWIAPQNAGRVTIALSRSDYSGHLPDALPAPGENGFQTADGSDTRAMVTPEAEDYLPPWGVNGNASSGCNTHGSTAWARSGTPVAAGSYLLGSSAQSAFARDVLVSIVPIPGQEQQAADYIGSLKNHCAFAAGRSNATMANLVRTANFGTVTRAYHVVFGDGAMEKLQFFAVSGGYYVYAEAAPIPAHVDSDGFTVDAVTRLAHALTKIDETLGTHFQPAHGSTPGTNWPGQAESAASISGLIGNWSGHSRGLSISSSGVAQMGWRTYTICGSAEAQPGYACESASNQFSEGGQVTMQLESSSGGVTAHVLKSNDSYYRGDIPVVVIKRDTGGRPSIISIGQPSDKVSMEFCSPAAAGQCGM